jgi:hypothetical protein
MLVVGCQHFTVTWPTPKQLKQHNGRATQPPPLLLLLLVLLVPALQLYCWGN